MLAARMYEKNDIRMEHVPTPEPGPGELLLRVKAAAVCGTDIRMIKNGAKGITPQSPCILGHEIAGIIEKTGAGVTAFHAGQRVAIAPNIGCGVCDTCVSGKGHLCPDYKALGINMDGGFAEYCLVPQSAVAQGNICLLSDNVSFEEAALNEPLSCVYNGFERARIEPGCNVLVVGAGPIGLMHCILALMAGANVYLSDISTDRLHQARKLYPAIRTISSDLKNEIMQATAGHGADVIITACPVPAIQTLAIEIAALEARIIFFGGIPEDKQPVALNTNAIHYKQLMVSGTTRASVSQYRKTLQLIAAGCIDIKPLITGRYSLGDIQEAIDCAARGEGIKHVIVF